MTALNYSRPGLSTSYRALVTYWAEINARLPAPCESDPLPHYADREPSAAARRALEPVCVSLPTTVDNA